MAGFTIAGPDVLRLSQRREQAHALNGDLIDVHAAERQRQLPDLPSYWTSSGALPTGHRWTYRPGVTLLGDAAHLTSPFSGEGMNLALLDAVELAHALAAGGDWKTALAAYEVTLCERSAEAAAGAAAGLEAALSLDAPVTVLAHMREHQLPSPSPNAGDTSMPESFQPAECPTALLRPVRGPMPTGERGKSHGAPGGARVIDSHDQRQ